MSFNVWQPQGNTVPNSGGNIYSNPNVIYDTNPVVLVGHTNVFKMWCCSVVHNEIFYFESLDGLTSWTAYSGNPIIGGSFPRVFKVGSTYYLYLSPDGTIGDKVSAYTSTDGVTFTEQNASAIAAGSSGAWDETVFQLCLADIIGGTWYAYYNGEKGSQSQMGLATSTDGINWTKSPANPVITTLSSNFTFFKASGVYYGMFDGAYNNAQLLANSFRNIFMLYSRNVQGPWQSFSFNGQPVSVYYAAIPGDFGSFNADNAIGDPSVVFANGNAYLYFSVSPHGVAAGTNAAVAPGITPAQLVATYQGVQNAPYSGALSLNTNQLASDTFARADSSPTSGNWTTLQTPDGTQIVSQRIEPQIATSALGASWNNGVVWPNDQYAQITVQAVAAGSDAGVGVRMSEANATTLYDLIWQGPLGSSGTYFIQKRISGTTTTLLSGTLTVHAGDTITGTVVGTLISFYWNGFLIGSATDSSLTAGASGMVTFGNTAVSDAIVNNYAGGTFQAAPPAPTLGGYSYAFEA